MKQFEQEYLGLRHVSLVMPVDKRPVCVNCGRPLKPQPYPVDRKFRLPDRIEIQSGGKLRPYMGSNADPEKDALLVKQALAEAKAWLSCRDGISDCKVVALWYGGYDGYTYGLRDPGVPLFCRSACGLEFGVASYRGGYRRTVE